ncbi:MAG: hypothetical protein GF313_09420 [Caldithrix sp.]|nr:hypothetical protein [Caldithrix sp.]
MKKRYIVLAPIFLFWVSMADAQGNHAAAFLDLGIGARPLAMGGSYVALSNDATGFFWNPGGMALLPGIQAASMYADLFGQLEQQSYLSAAMPLFGGGAISLGWIRSSIDDIPRYLFEEDPGINAFQRINGDAEPLTADPDGYFGSADDALFITFAKYIPWTVDLGWQYFELPIDIGIGMNMKMIRQKLDDKSGTGIGVDAGILMRLGLNELFAEDGYGDLSFGLNFQDATNTQIEWNTVSAREDNVGRNVKYGFAYVQPLAFMNSRFTISYDVDTKYKGTTHLGSELLYHSFLAVRVGLNAGYFTTGAGIYLWKIGIDYAYQSHVLGNSHRVSLIFKL